MNTDKTSRAKSAKSTRQPAAASRVGENTASGPKTRSSNVSEAASAAAPGEHRLLAGGAARVPVGTVDTSPAASGVQRARNSGSYAEHAVLRESSRTGLGSTGPVLHSALRAEGRPERIATRALKSKADREEEKAKEEQMRRENARRLKEIKTKTTSIVLPPISPAKSAKPDKQEKTTDPSTVAAHDPDDDKSIQSEDSFDPESQNGNSGNEEIVDRKKMERIVDSCVSDADFSLKAVGDALEERRTLEKELSTLMYMVNQQKEHHSREMERLRRESESRENEIEKMQEIIDTLKSESSARQAVGQATQDTFDNTNVSIYSIYATGKQNEDQYASPPLDFTFTQRELCNTPAMESLRVSAVPNENSLLGYVYPHNTGIDQRMSFLTTHTKSLMQMADKDRKEKSLRLLKLNARKKMHCRSIIARSLQNRNKKCMQKIIYVLRAARKHKAYANKGVALMKIRQNMRTLRGGFKGIFEYAVITTETKRMFSKAFKSVKVKWVIEYLKLTCKAWNAVTTFNQRVSRGITNIGQLRKFRCKRLFFGDLKAHVRVSGAKYRRLSTFRDRFDQKMMKHAVSGWRNYVEKQGIKAEKLALEFRVQTERLELEERAAAERRESLVRGAMRMLEFSAHSQQQLDNTRYSIDADISVYCPRQLIFSSPVSQGIITTQMQTDTNHTTVLAEAVMVPTSTEEVDVHPEHLTSLIRKLAFAEVEAGAAAKIQALAESGEQAAAETLSTAGAPVLAEAELPAVAQQFEKVTVRDMEDSYDAIVLETAKEIMKNQRRTLELNIRRIGFPAPIVFHTFDKTIEIYAETITRTNFGNHLIFEQRIENSRLNFGGPALDFLRSMNSGVDDFKKQWCIDSEFTFAIMALVMAIKGTDKNVWVVAGTSADQIGPAIVYQTQQQIVSQQTPQQQAQTTPAQQQTAQPVIQQQQAAPTATAQQQAAPTATAQQQTGQSGDPDMITYFDKYGRPYQMRRPGRR